MADNCLSFVAKQIVFFTVKLFIFSFNFSTILLNDSKFAVVWLTTQYAFVGSNVILSISSTLFIIIALLLHHPLIPIISGWAEFPIMMISYPLSEKSFTISWIFLTKGHVVSTISISFDLDSVYTFSPTPWDLMISLLFDGISSKSSFSIRPFSLYLSTACLLWIRGPKE